MLSRWDKTIIDDIYGVNICLNSQGTTFSNYIQPLGIKKKITEEFQFFDTKYFEAK